MSDKGLAEIKPDKVVVSYFRHGIEMFPHEKEKPRRADLVEVTLKKDLTSIGYGITFDEAVKEAVADYHAQCRKRGKIRAQLGERSFIVKELRG